MFQVCIPDCIAKRYRYLVLWELQGCSPTMYQFF